MEGLRDRDTVTTCPIWWTPTRAPGFPGPRPGRSWTLGCRPAKTAVAKAKVEIDDVLTRIENPTLVSAFEFLSSELDSAEQRLAAVKS